MLVFKKTNIYFIVSLSYRTHQFNNILLNITLIMVLPWRNLIYHLYSYALYLVIIKFYDNGKIKYSQIHVNTARSSKNVKHFLNSTNHVILFSIDKSYVVVTSSNEEKVNVFSFEITSVQYSFNVMGFSLFLFIHHYIH